MQIEQNLNSIIEIGPCNRLHIFGGGQGAIKAAKIAKELNFDVHVFTSARLVSEKFNELIFSDELKKINVPYSVHDSLNESGILKMYENTDGNVLNLSMGAPWIFNKKFLENSQVGPIFNFHGTRLPQNRGGGGFTWQILMDNYLGFVQMHLVDTGIDTGELVYTKEFLYPSNCRIPIDFQKYYRLQLDLFLNEFLKGISCETIQLKKISQQNYFSTYWPRISTDLHGWINWEDQCLNIDRFIRSFDEPYQGASTLINKKRVWLKGSRPNFNDGLFHSFQSGIIYRKSPGWINVATSGGALIIESVLDENKINIMDSISVGDRFYTPNENFNNKQDRLIYRP